MGGATSRRPRRKSFPGGKRSGRPQIPAWLPLREPPTWREVASTPKLFAGVAEEVWDDFDGLWRDPKVDGALRRQRVRFVQNLNSWVRDLRRLDLGSLSTTRLLAAFRHSYWGETVLQNVAPIPPLRDRIAQLAVGYETLIRYGLLRSASEPVGDPLGLALAVGTAQVPGVLIWDEVLRRGAQHRPGFAAAILRLGHELSRLGTQANRWVEAAAGSYGRERISQAFVTVDEEWGDLDPFEALGRALRGRLNIATTAIRGDLIDEYRKLHPKREVTPKQEVTIEFQKNGAGAERSRREREGHLHVRSELDSALRALRREHPLLKLDSYVDALMDGKNQKEAAAAAGVSPRTARSYETVLRGALGHIISPS